VLHEFESIQISTFESHTTSFRIIVGVGLCALTDALDEENKCANQVKYRLGCRHRIRYSRDRVGCVELVVEGGSSCDVHAAKAPRESVIVENNKSCAEFGILTSMPPALSPGTLPFGGPSHF
jgi:hypothetical protein